MKILLIVSALLGSVCSFPQVQTRGYGGSSPGRAPARPQQQPQRAPSQQNCRTEYVTVWDTQYEESVTQECSTTYVNQCTTQKQCYQDTRKACQTVDEQQCATQPPECRDVPRYESYTDTQCRTEQLCQQEWVKQPCNSGYGGCRNDEDWVDIPSTCQDVRKCEDVVKQRQVKEKVCGQPQRLCVTVPVTNCEQVPYQRCENVQKCNDVPKQSCKDKHIRTPVQKSRRKPNRVCDGGSLSGGYGGSQGNQQQLPQRGPSQQGGGGYGSGVSNPGRLPSRQPQGNQGGGGFQGNQGGGGILLDVIQGNQGGNDVGIRRNEISFGDPNDDAEEIGANLPRDSGTDESRINFEG